MSNAASRPSTVTPSRGADPLNRRILIVALGLVCISSVGRGDEAIGTTNGTYVLTDVKSLVDATARQTADRTAQLAVAGVAADAADDEKELKEIQEKITTHNKVIDQLNQELSDYKTALTAYNAKLTPHNNQVAQYNSEVADQRAQVAKSNSLPAQQRSATAVNRLNNWKARLDKRQAELNREKSELDAQKAILDPKSQSINSRSQTLDTEAKELNAELDSIKAKLGDAYRQLQLCYNYSVQMKEILRKDGVATSAEDQATLEGTSATLERLKIVSNVGVNNNAEKASVNSGDVQSPNSGTPNE
jgi:chromosome segregation ATPase